MLQIRVADPHACQPKTIDAPTLSQPALASVDVVALREPPPAPERETACSSVPSGQSNVQPVVSGGRVRSGFARSTIQRMADTKGARAAAYAAAFEAAQAEFIRLIESLTDEQWHRSGRNFPQRINDEDEHRPVGVIAHHVAVNAPWIMERVARMLDGRPLPPVDFQIVNTRHAAEYAAVSKEAVLRLLREQLTPIATAIRAIPDDQLDQTRDTPAGPMSVAQRLERVLVGHMKTHQGSIEAAIR